MTDLHHSNKKRLAIVGAGPAGMAAGLWAVRLGLDALILEQNEDLGGQLLSYSLPIVDLPGLARVSGSEFARHLASQIESLGVHIVRRERVTGWSDGRVTTETGHQYAADWLLYAPGLRVRTLNIPGIEHAFSGSVSDLVERPGAGRVLVVGGGDRAIEGALRLHRSGWHVTVAVRAQSVAASYPYRQALSNSQISVWYATRLRELTRLEQQVRADLVQGSVAESPVRWTGDEVLVRIGMEPDIHPPFAALHHDVSQSQLLGMTVIGDAALPSWARSLTSAFASSMQAVKAYAKSASR